MEVAEPLAAILDRYLPERAKGLVETGLDPFDVLAGLWHISAHCQANERAIIAEFRASRSPIPNAAPHAAAPNEPGEVLDITEMILADQAEAMLDEEVPV